MHKGNWFNQNDNRHAFNTQPYCCPPQTMPDMQAPAQMSPTREYVRTNIFNTYVPHIHPSHTTNVNKHCIHHQHYFPHTESTVEECYETNTICRTPTDGCCPSKRKWR